MGSNPSHFKGEKLPVETVSWKDCQDFCRKTGLNLPTEVQWEFASRAGTTTPFAFGENLTSTQANFDHPRGKTVAIDSFAPNKFGIHNMHGNVCEWCEDRYEAYGPDPAVDTVGSQKKFLYVIRGGGFKSLELELRSASRDRTHLVTRLPDIGFRPTVTLK